MATNKKTPEEKVEKMVVEKPSLTLPLQTFSFPRHGVTIKATSLEEAMKKLHGESECTTCL